MNVLSLLVSRQYPMQCRKCKLITDKIVDHLFCHCSANFELQNTLLNIWMDTVGFPGTLDLIKYCPREQCIIVLKVALELHADLQTFKHIHLLTTVCKLFA